MNKKLILIGLLVLLFIVLVACTQDYSTGAQTASSQGQEYVAQGCGVV